MGTEFCPYIAEPNKEWRQKEPVRTTLSHNVSALRQELDLSLETLAQRTGLSLATLQAIEAGRGEILLDDLEVLAQALGVSIGALFK